MTSLDIKDVIAVHQAAFPRQMHSAEWIQCNLNAFPRMQYFVYVNNEGSIVGFIHWTQKSGFRQDVVLELEQIAVHPKYQNCGIGEQLIVHSIPLVQSQVSERGAKLKHIVVTTRVDNHAQRLYRKILGAEIEATISNLCSSDEVFMVARNIDV